MTTSVSLPKWLARVVTPAEIAVVDFIGRRFETNDTELLAALALVVLAQRAGHSCVDLRRVDELVRQHLHDDVPNNDLDDAPTSQTLVNLLQRHPELVLVAGSDLSSAFAEAQTRCLPFVLMGEYLYSQRQFVDELSIAHQINERTRLLATSEVDPALIDRIVPKPDPVDEKAAEAGDTGIANRAGKSFVSRRFTVLTGGPGTGKTFTLTRCLAALLASREGQSVETRLALVAPTGKAAARAKDLIDAFVAEQRNSGAAALGLSETVLNQLAHIEPRTIHRLLGSKGRQRTRFAHHADRQLDIDVLVVDEMSMVPSALMARLLEALKPTTTILLVGDQAQLEAVESGSVLREIVEYGQSLDEESSWVFELKRVWRQADDTQIGDLARLIRAGRASEVAEFVQQGPKGVRTSVAVGDLTESDSPINAYVTLLGEVRAKASSTNEADHKTAFDLVSSNKLLCGPRQGRTGINHWNNAIHEHLHGVARLGQYEVGVPLLVTVNSARARLVNGDIGLVVNTKNPDGSVTRAVYFNDGDQGRYLSPAQLPAFEVCFAMTIHKSQGSEYDNLVVILPSDGSPLLNRELIYTAVTRAKKSLTIIGDTQLLATAVANKSSRFSALRQMLD